MSIKSEMDNEAEKYFKYADRGGGREVAFALPFMRDFWFYMYEWLNKNEENIMNRLFLISNGYAVKQLHLPQQEWSVVLPDNSTIPPEGCISETEAWNLAYMHLIKSKNSPKIEDLQKIIDDLKKENEILKAELEFTKRHYAHKVGVGQTIELYTEKDPL